MDDAKNKLAPALRPISWWRFKRFDWHTDGNWVLVFLYAGVIHRHVRQLLDDQPLVTTWLPDRSDREPAVFLAGLALFMLIAKAFQSFSKRREIAPKLRLVASSLIESVAVQFAILIAGLLLIGLADLLGKVSAFSPGSFAHPGIYAFMGMFGLAAIGGGYHCASRLNGREILAGIGATMIVPAMILGTTMFPNTPEMPLDSSQQLLGGLVIAAAYLALGGLGGYWAARQKQNSDSPDSAAP